MQYAVIALSGKQYKVKSGDIIETETLAFKPGEKTILNEVLLLVTDGKVIIGTPRIEGAAVKVTILEHTKGKKVRISKFKSKARYRRVTGNRQSLTKVKIDEIVSKEKEVEKSKETSGKTAPKAKK